jgi:CheY-like chemotaxis protein
MKLGVCMNTILVVDDSKFARLSIARMLQEANFQTIEASNGKEAISLMSTLDSMPDLIICDIMMPEMDGYEFYSYISTKPEWNHIPFIFLTAKSSPEDIRIGKMLGADDYLIKPVDSRDLIASVKGKISRNQYRLLMQNKIQQVINPTINSTTIDNECMDSSFMLILIKWDDIWGPLVQKQYQQNNSICVDTSKIGEQVFNVVNAVFGHEAYQCAADSLMHLSNFNSDAYLLVDFKPNTAFRGGYELYLICIIAPRIDYLKSTKLKQLFLRISEIEKRNQDWKFEDYISEVNEIFRKT